MYAPQYKKPDLYYNVKIIELKGEGEDEVMIAITNTSH